MNSQSQNILTMRVDPASYDDAVTRILGWQEHKCEGRYVCLANVHMCMEAQDSHFFRSVVNGADMVLPDGMPLVWALRLLGVRKAGQVRGSDLLLAICKEAERRHIPIGLYGGSPASLHDFQKFLRRHFPELAIGCAISPPFRYLTEEEDTMFVEEIINSGVRILFVGIGCPKQETWMAGHRKSLPCTMVGVGAAFDFFSGRKRHAPRFMQRAGLEWTFRLASEPRRLWKRYLKHNPRYLYYFGRQWLSVLKSRIMEKPAPLPASEKISPMQ